MTHDIVDLEKKMSSSRFQLRDWIAFDLEWIVAATEGTGISIRQISPAPRLRKCRKDIRC